jgi:hypothetical protein
MPTETPSTTAENPLQNSLARITGQDPLSQSAGTSSLISYDDTSAGFRSPQGDVISIQSSPGTGASTAETWSHEAELERLKQSQLEFQYSQQQNELANAIRQQENQRAGEKLALDRAMHDASMRQMQQQYEQGQKELAMKQRASDIEMANYMRQYGDPNYYLSGQYRADQARSQMSNLGSQAAWERMQGTGIPYNTMKTLDAVQKSSPEMRAVFNAAYNNQLQQRSPDVQRDWRYQGAQSPVRMYG